MFMTCPDKKLAVRVNQPPEGNDRFSKNYFMEMILPKVELHEIVFIPKLDEELSLSEILELQDLDAFED